MKLRKARAKIAEFGLPVAFCKDDQEVEFMMDYFEDFEIKNRIDCPDSCDNCPYSQYCN